jgi:Restriction endonuclease AspBHI N-terminal/Restriction endonuclease
MESRLGNRYRLGHEYRDTGGSGNESDQFLRWLNIPGSGMKNMPGIRPFKFTNLKNVPIHAYIVLVTHERSANRTANPWEDFVDVNAGRIIYWGDAKWDAKRTLDDFVGNRALRAAFDAVLAGRLDIAPPILHFSKPRPGVVVFNGLCSLERLELSWFEDNGRPVRNYRAHLAILDEEFADVDWLHRRATAGDVSQLEGDGPSAWRDYQAGLLRRLQVWAPRIRSKQAQLPPDDSPDARVLAELTRMSPPIFEGAIVSVFEELEIVHRVTQTRPTADGGFDFFGAFTLPPPLEYEIDFRGEVKRYQRTTGVGVKDVSRLVARLGRGQYGLFVTTSYFSPQAQAEVLEDRYPTALFAGVDVVRLLKELGAARAGTLSPRWLSAVEQRQATA